MTYVYHLDQSTGRASRVARCSVPEAIMTAAADYLDRAIAADAADEPPAPITDRLALGAIPSGRCLILTVHQGERIEARIGVAGHARCAVRLWQVLTEVYPLCPLYGERPQQPWCALQISPQSQHQGWLREYAPALAWAWMERAREVV